MVKLSFENHVYMVRSSAVTTAADATDVVHTLERALQDWRTKGGADEFMHRIEMEGLAAICLPVPTESAVQEDMRFGKGAHAEMVQALQPGWFWLHVVRLDGGDQAVMRWLEAVKAAFAAKGEYESLWEMGEVGMQLGESAVMPLALRDARWIPAYMEFLALWDLGHEVNQQPTINAMFEAHGWSDAMRALLIERVRIDGQHGTDQVFGELRGALAALLPPEEFTAFYHDALSAFRASTTSWLGWPLAENSKKTFSIDGPLVAIADALPSNNVEKK